MYEVVYGEAIVSKPKLLTSYLLEAMGAIDLSMLLGWRNPYLIE
jgi:hypothetical protein